jgi:mannitol-1-phosphate/altronate dehydrogenase
VNRRKESFDVTEKAHGVGKKRERLKLFFPQELLISVEYVDGKEFESIPGQLEQRVGNPYIRQLTSDIADVGLQKRKPRSLTTETRQAEDSASLGVERSLKQLS